MSEQRGTEERERPGDPEAPGAPATPAVNDPPADSTTTTSADPAEADPATDTAPGTDTDPGTDTKPGTDAGPAGEAETGGDVETGGERVETGAEAAGDTEGKGGEFWEHFAPQAEPVPGRVRRVLLAVGRFCVHEWVLACVGGLALAVVMTWPTMRDPRHTIPADLGDPMLQAWQMAWAGHVMKTAPGQLWDANLFYPLKWSFAFTDTLLGYLPASMIGSGPEDAVLRYNIMFVLLHALAFVGGYALLRQLGSRRPGAAAMAAAFAFAPWRGAQAGHMHILSTGGIVLSLAMLARGHGWSLRHGYRPERARAGWIVAGWAVAAWQITLSFGLGIPFAYLLLTIGLICVGRYLWHRWRRKSWLPFRRGLLFANIGGGVLFALVTLAMAYPYFHVLAEHPEAKRSVGDLQLYSPPWNGFFTAPAQSTLWGPLHQAARDAMSWPGEWVVLPGFVLMGLAAAGLVVSIWTPRQRAWIAGGTLVFACLAMGTRFFGGEVGYVFLFRHLPGFDAGRTPGRLVLYVTIGLCVLAAGAVSAFAERAYELANTRPLAGPGIPLRLAMVIPLLLVLVDTAQIALPLDYGSSTSVVPQTRGLSHPTVPTAPAILRAAPGPMVIMPAGGNDFAYMLWSTDRFPDMANGISGFYPGKQTEVFERMKSFPDADSVDYLRQLGFRSVVVLRDQAQGDADAKRILEAGTGDLPGLTKEDLPDGVIFRFE